MPWRLAVVAALATAVACSNEQPTGDDQAQTAALRDDTTSEIEVVGKRVEPRPIPDDCRYDKLLASLTAARSRWQGYGIDIYRMTVEHSAMYHYSNWPNSTPLKLQVRNGTVASNLSDISEATLQSVTIDGLFSLIEATVRKAPDCLKVSFDPTWGFPTSIYVDGELDVSDDEFMYEISEFGP